MTERIPPSHPYWHVHDIVERHTDVISVSASYYAYRPQTVADPRTELTIPVRDFLDEQQVLAYMKATPEGHEMALHSNVRMQGDSVAHLVMVDMSTRSKAHLLKLRKFLGDHFFQRMTWFESGRSFHGYGDTFIDVDEWVKFMGVLLLANQPNLEATVDPRWIGHRLLAGFSSLRWTKNTPYYRGQPEKVDPNIQKASAVMEVGPVGRKI